MEKRLRIALFEPPRLAVGGGPKLTARMAAHLSEKHYVEIFTQGHHNKDFGLDFNKAKITHIKPKNIFLSPFAFLGKKVSGFDVVIVGQFPANLGAIRNNPTLRICCSPTRSFYDLRKYLFNNSNLKGKIKLVAKNVLFKGLDLYAARKTTQFLAVSENIKGRVKKFYSRDSIVFYPGIDFHNFKSGRYDDYVLSVARFTPAKRVDMIIKSMGHVKNKKIKLYVVGGGENKKETEKLCKKYPNVKFFGFVSDKKLVELYANCLSLVYIPVDEDEGYVPIEAGASFKPTIGVNEGGLKETIIDGKTGFLINDVTSKKVAEKIDFLAINKKLAKKMGLAANKHTFKFDWQNTLPVLERAVEKLAQVNKN